jgi:hypothetical protein
MAVTDEHHVEGPRGAPSENRGGCGSLIEERDGNPGEKGRPERPRPLMLSFGGSVNPK